MLGFKWSRWVIWIAQKKVIGHGFQWEQTRIAMKEEAKKYLYFDIPKQERDSAIAFLLDALLKSKIASGKKAARVDDSDEDVNIYLAHLLFAASLPDYQKTIQRYLSASVSEMTELVEENDDRIVRYFIYKVNADHLLVHLGIFQDLDSSLSTFGKSERQYASMAQNYYQQAMDYNHRIYRRQTAIGSVLEKLALGFERYQKILRFTRRDFFHFENHFRDDGFMKFCNDVKKYEHDLAATGVRDRFLDCYLEWKRTKDPNVRLRLVRAVGEMKNIDPDFEFRIDGEV